MRILWRITKQTFRYRRSLVLTYATVAGVTVFTMLIPRIVGTAVDAIFPKDGVIAADAPQQLLLLALYIMVVYLIRGIFAFGQTYLGEAVSQKVSYDLRNEFYDHLQRLSFAFHDKEHTGNLMSKATADVEAIRRFVQSGLIRSVHMAILLLGVGAVMLLLNWQLALLSLVFVPIILWRIGYLSILMRRTWLVVQNEMGHMTTVLQENLSGQRVVKAFAAEEHERSKYNYRAANVAHYSYMAAVYQASNTGLMTFFYVGATALVLWAGGRQVIAGTLTEGDLTQFILYLGLLAQPVRMVAFVINSFTRAISAGERIFATLDTVSPVQEKRNARILPRLQGHVRFENVSFSYDAISPVLKDVSFDAEPAKVIALVGTAGSGKSTIVHLIPRFYDTTEGRITVDGTDIRDAALASLRANIGIVQQDVFLFTSTIRDNIAYGNVDATFEEIVRAATIAQLHDFIMSLPREYDTWVGERGITLSGGQRQRLAIARTILLDPPILILDDSTSSVDTETEYLIRKAMVEVMKGRTTFIIAHRISTVKNADLILVLKDGQIVQRGSHGELLSKPGPYQEIYELQLRPQEAILTNGTQPSDLEVGSTAEAAATSSEEGE